MSATNAHDEQRLLLENVLAHLVAARRCLSVAGTRMVQRVRTEPERDDLQELIAARVELEKAARMLARFHPDRLEER